MMMVNFSKSEKLRAGLIALLTGIFLAQFFDQAKYFLFFGGTFLALAVMLKKEILTIFAILFLSVFYAQWRDFSAFAHDPLEISMGETALISGRIVSFLDEREKNTRVFFQVSELNGRAVDGKILLIFQKDLKLKYGDEISFSGKIGKPKNFQDFNYSAYLKRFGATAIVKNPKNVKIIAHDKGSWFLQSASKARDFFTQNLAKSLPIPHDRIATGILLGVKNALPEAVSNDFKRSGLTHLLVVSGFNVSVVVILIAMIFKKLGQRLVFITSVVAIFFFVAMTGGDAPVIRAAIMGSIAGWATATGKIGDARNTVLLSAVIIGIFSPAVIQRDIGFFLSFSATVGIVLFSEVFEKWFSLLPERFEIRQIVAVLTAAQISVFPILGFYFGQFPLIGFVSNLFAEPLVPLAMAFSAVPTIGGLLPVFLAKTLAIPAFIVLEILITIAHVFGKIPPIPIAKNVAIVFQFLVILGFLWGFFRRKNC